MTMRVRFPPQAPFYKDFYIMWGKSHIKNIYHKNVGNVWEYYQITSLK